MWEYDVIWLGDPNDVEKVKGRLNEAAAEGWELVSYVEGYGIFKRNACKCESCQIASTTSE